MDTLSKKDRITHPFHPLFDQEFDLVSYRRSWGKESVECLDKNRQLISVPLDWADAAEKDSFSTIVNATVFTRIALPEMIRLKYKPGVGAAAIAAAGTLASLIPPSLQFVIFAILTEQSIGKLLLTGLLPGILTWWCI